MIISYNIGYSSISLGERGILTFPYLFTCKNLREFSDLVRSPSFIEEVLDLAKEKYVRPSSMALFLNINNEKYFLIQLLNVKEYKLGYDKYILSKRNN